MDFTPFLMCLMAFIGDSKNKIHACLNKWCKTKSIGYMKSVNRLNGALHRIRNGCWTLWTFGKHCKHISLVLKMKTFSLEAFSPNSNWIRCLQQLLCFHKNKTLQIRFGTAKIRCENGSFQWKKKPEKKEIHYIKYVSSFASGGKSRSFCLPLLCLLLSFCLFVFVTHWLVCSLCFQHHHFNVVMCLFSKIVSIFFLDTREINFERWEWNRYQKKNETKTEMKKKERTTIITSWL